jgi:hypothetical protein
MSIVAAGGWRLLFKKSGVFVTPDKFSISMSGLLGPCVDRSIAGDSGGGMNKGGGEFSCSGEGVVPVDLSWGVRDATGVCDIVEDVGVSICWLRLWSVVECGGHD